MAQSKPVWHTETAVQAAVKRFRDQYAEVPKKALQEAKRYNERFLKAIRVYLKGKDITGGRFEYEGSSYEGLKISGVCEVDILIILRGSVTPSSRVRPGYYNLSASKGR